MSETKASLKDTGIVCAVDMGSNTFKFLIAEIKNGKYVQYSDIRKTVGVGDDLKKSEKETGHKVISERKLQEIQAILAEFQDECEQRTQSRKLSGIATAAFREAENNKTIVQALQEQGIDVEILTGKQESAYAYEAATLGEPGYAVLDVGSRTTEFVIKTGADYESVELTTGYKVAWDEFYEHAETFPIARTNHRKPLTTLIGEKEVSILKGQKELVVIESGETASYVLGIPQDQVEGKVITQSQMDQRMQELAAMTREDFAKFKNTFKDTIKVLPRLVLIDLVLSQTGYEKFRATDHELNLAIIYRLAR